ncbi:flagellar basal body L-ring protein FlgH [Falsirhodobacter halotolerans]|uniref:flagellar basal body L-ring protein FlgH n=1 Tax=Falsirhodobacter halotolerans TaxID=1146892 RepID=UPI001FD4F8AE|nr:flagellar basal body L-ring protein FlgH [Falsirhodobacter halotolerans]MCJ8140558.1 flagellar basal body L-ring protein FlgH [Falsirhodobacter halotolerans]
MRVALLGLIALTALGACTRMSQVGKAPGFTGLETSSQFNSLYSTPLPDSAAQTTPAVQSSLWTGSRTALLSDRRAERRGDILTVVIEINDSAEMKNTSGRSRAGTDSMRIPQLIGLPQRLDGKISGDASLANAVNTSSTHNYEGDGSTKRQEKLELRVAATVIEELPNGVLRIEGQQEVRVNYELRELMVTGYVRPADISRQNEVTYDKIAGARVAYGGRGQITDVQQPRYGQQIADIVLPF